MRVYDDYIVKRAYRRDYRGSQNVHYMGQTEPFIIIFARAYLLPVRDYSNIHPSKTDTAQQVPKRNHQTGRLPNPNSVLLIEFGFGVIENFVHVKS